MMPRRRPAAHAALVAAALLIGASVAHSSTEACRHVDLQGAVVAGQRFEASIGDGLIFRLDSEPGPAGSGWTVRVLRPPQDDEDYVEVMTPPYHGVNARFIEGWHFRNQDNTGPNAGDVNAPQHERDVSFVLTRVDYLVARDALERWLWPRTGDTDEDRVRALARHEDVPRGEGRLRIVELDLGTLGLGRRATIQRMKFTVGLCLPAPARP